MVKCNFISSESMNVWINDGQQVTCLEDECILRQSGHPASKHQSDIGYDTGLSRKNITVTHQLYLTKDVKVLICDE